MSRTANRAQLEPILIQPIISCFATECALLDTTVQLVHQMELKMNAKKDTTVPLEVEVQPCVKLEHTVWQKLQVALTALLVGMVQQQV